MQILEITFKVTHTVHLENMQQKDNYSAYGCYLLYLALLFHANRMKFLQTFYWGGWMKEGRAFRMLIQSGLYGLTSIQMREVKNISHYL